MAQSGAQIKTDSAAMAQRLQAATTELQELERLVLTGDFSPRVLSEFRSAVDNVRQTAWTVQQWIGLQEQSRDPYTVMSALSAERVRRATQINRDLAIDLQSLEVGLETDGLKELFGAVNDLHEAMAPLFPKRL
jgi:hypothetical protein